MLNLKKLCVDFNIPFWTEGKNVTIGWTNIQCPFCDDESNHLGFSPHGKFYCWKCGSKHTQKVIQKVCDVDPFTARSIYIKYDTSARFHLLKREERKVPEIVELPRTDLKLNPTARSYLENRGFDPDYLQEKYGILSTNHLNQDYKFRVIIPIFNRKKIVSFVGRDYTDEQELRYKTCPKEKEIIPHKHTLYNLDNCKNDYCIVVEGIFDCWRMGDDCCSTLGASWTEWQASVLMRRFKKICVLFDNDETGHNQGRHLRSFLEIMGTQAIQMKIEGHKKDPAEFSETEAQQNKKQIVRLLKNI